MNPFNLASQAGNSTKDILLFASKAIPGLEDKIKYAISAGYSAEEVLKFLQSAFTDGKSLKRYSQKTANKPLGAQIAKMGTQEEQQEYARIRNKRIQSILEPEKLISTAVGAGIGATIGGPAGAIGGAAAGSEAYEDILRKYEKHINQGGNLSLKDFLGTIVKSGLKGAGVTATVSTAKQMLDSLMKKEQPQEPEAHLLEGQESSTEGTAIEPIEPIEMAPEAGAESYEFLQKRGLGRIIDNFADQITPEEGRKALKKLYGADYIKDIERETKKPLEKLLGEAFEYVKLHGGTDQAEDISQSLSERRPLSEKESLAPVITSAASTSEGEAARQQRRDSSKISTLAPPSEDEATRQIKPSALTGPASTELEIGSIHPSFPNRIIRQKYSESNKILEKITEKKPALDNLLNGIKKKFDSSVDKVESRIKDKTRIKNKIEQKGAPETISDYLGSRIVINNMDDLYNIEKEIKDKFNIIEKEDFFDGREDGYRGIHYQVDLGNGTTAEIQVFPKETNDIFKQAHNIYDKWKRQSNFNKEEALAYSNDVSEMKSLFEGAWNKFEERTKKAQQSRFVEKPEKIEKKEQPKMDEVLSKLGWPGVKEPKKLTRPMTPIEALPSSNIRGLHYDAKTKKLQTLFGSGQTYEYTDVPLENFQGAAQGSDTTTTEGESVFRAFFRGKNPSIGAAFDEFIKKPGFEYEQLDPREVKDKGLKSIRATDQVFVASQFVDAFRHITEKAKAKQKLPGAKEKFDLLKQLDEDTAAALLLVAENELKSQMKRKTKKAVGEKLEELKKKL